MRCMQGVGQGRAAYQRALLVACGRKVLMMPAAWWPRRSRRSPLGWYPRVANAVQASSASDGVASVTCMQGAENVKETFFHRLQSRPRYAGAQQVHPSSAAVSKAARACRMSAAHTWQLLAGEHSAQQADSVPLQRAGTRSPESAHPTSCWRRPAPRSAAPGAGRPPPAAGRPRCATPGSAGPPCPAAAAWPGGAAPSPRSPRQTPSPTRPPPPGPAHIIAAAQLNSPNCRAEFRPTGSVRDWHAV